MAAFTVGRVDTETTTFKSSLYQKYCVKAKEQEAILLKLTQELVALQNGEVSNEESKELEDLRIANSKMRFRVGILKQAVENSGNLKGTVMLNIHRALFDVFTIAITDAFPHLPDHPVMLTLSKTADYQCNSAMQISQIIKSQGQKSNPRDVAQAIVDKVPSNDLIEDVSVAGPGFINIYLKKLFVESQVTQILIRGVVPPKTEKKKIVVDFSSPNIAKEMHVGHLRSTIIGDSISRLFEFMGHDVVRLNHVGDWGTQFGMLIAHLQETFPDYLDKPPPIADLQEFYKASKRRFDEDEDFKKKAYNCVVKLQAYDDEHYKAWKMICDISRKEFQKIYDRLNINLEERGESFYQDYMVKLVADLKERNLMEEDDGRWIMFSEGHNVPLTIVKSDGGFTYDTSDMACVRQRVDEEKADRIVYVTDLGQGDHFKLIFDCAAKCGFVDKRKIRTDHVGFGVVLGEDKKKFKTRSGDTVRLVDLLDEGLRRAGEKLKERERDKVLSEDEMKIAQESVAYGCIKYADLSHNRNHEYVFSFDKMLDDRGNTAAYLLYALTRIRSISRNANVPTTKLIQEAEQSPLNLQDPKEIKLAKTLLKFPEIIEKIVEDLCMHSLCEYLYEVSTTFTDFYDTCYCVVRDKNTGEVVNINISRLQLCEATAVVMEKCFSILGIKTLSKM